MWRKFIQWLCSLILGRSQEDEADTCECLSPRATEDLRHHDCTGAHRRRMRDGEYAW